MGIRGELFSTRVSCEGRTYFFNVKQNRMGDVFLSIVESKPTEPETFDRRSIVVFGSDVKPFIKAFQTALSFMEKPKEAAKPLSFHPADPMPPRRMPKRIKMSEPAADATGQGDPSDGAGEAKTGLTADSALGGMSSGAATGHDQPAGILPEKKRRIVVKRAKQGAGKSPESDGKDSLPGSD